jgi:Up-Regulated in long-lived daf-2
MSDYNNSALVKVTNNSGGNAEITLSHRYSSDPVQTRTWKVGPGQITTPPLSVGFNTGFIRTGKDYWWIGIQVLDGPAAGYYASRGSADDPGKECMLESDDNGKTLTFSVDTSTFVIQQVSGSCSTGMDKKTTAQAVEAKVSEEKATN